MDKPNNERKKTNDFSFEEIVEQNERRIHYHIHRLGIHDPFGDFYAEGLYAMWTAYKKYEPDKRALATYFNYIIRNRLIDMIRKNSREIEQKEAYLENEKQLLSSQITEIRNNIIEGSDKRLLEDEFWQEVRRNLTENQWNWVYYRIILDMPLKEIADLKGVSVEAVKSWGKGARRKLRMVLIENEK